MSVPTVAISIPKKSLSSIRCSLQITFLFAPSGSLFVTFGLNVVIFLRFSPKVCRFHDDYTVLDKTKEWVLIQTEDGDFPYQGWIQEKQLCEISEEQLLYYKHHACPSCGACSFMGTASTMQIMAEALGLMLPGSALMPATSIELKEMAHHAGIQVLELVKKGIKVSDIVTKEAFENAIMVHAAISGSTNSLLHIPAIAHELGIEIDSDTFDRMHRGAHYLLDIRPAGRWPAQFFYYAGGVPAVMEEIKSMLHLDVMTVTGKTLGENLEDLKKSGFYEHCDRILREKTEALGLSVSRTDIIHDFDHAKGESEAV